jgi:Arc/MetJ-type ribon-helix-helix transcriptional regulator
VTNKKFSVSLPEELAAAVRERVEPGEFSAYVAEALEQQIAMDKLREIVDDFNAHNDPLTEEEIEAARAVLRHDKKGTSGAAD